MDQRAYIKGYRRIEKSKHCDSKNDKKIFELENIYNNFSHRKSRNFLIFQGIPALLVISSVENGILLFYD